MLSATDKENVTKASQAMGIAVSDLRAIAASKNPLLAELGVDILSVAIELGQKLQRLEVLTRDDAGA